MKKICKTVIFCLTNTHKLYIVYIYRRGDNLQIIISNSVDTPIYEQIVSSIKESILKGELMGGEMLPSIRSLAKDLRISNITTKRAYEELEHDGFITPVPGKGYFVKKKSEEFLKEEGIVKFKFECDLTGRIRYLFIFNE